MLSIVLSTTTVTTADSSTSRQLEDAAQLLADGRPNAAINTLEAVAQAEPDNPWMLFYRGSAHVMLGNAQQAVDDYDHALKVLEDYGNPDPEFTARIRRHRRHARRSLFNVSIESGLAYDTNVTFLGDDAAGTFDVISGQADEKFATRVQLDASILSDRDQTLAAGLRLGQAWHFSVDEFDFQDYGGYARYTRRLTSDIEAELRYDYDFTLLGRDSFLSLHALTPSVSYNWRPTDNTFGPDRTRAFYQFQARDFLFDTTPVFDRDGVGHAIGVEQSFDLTPLPAWNWELTLGYRFGSIATRGSEFDRLTHDLLFGLAIPILNPAEPTEYLILPDKELMFRFNTDLHWADYRNPSTIDAQRDNRRDFTPVYNWAVSQKLVEDPRIGDITLHGIIQWTNATSTVNIGDVEPFTYSQIIYGLQLAWQW